MVLSRKRKEIGKEKVHIILLIGKAQSKNKKSSKFCWIMKKHINNGANIYFALFVL
jgi:hypothetical protein